MNISILLPNLDPTSETRNIVEIIRGLLKEGQNITVYHSDGSRCKWTSLQVSIKPLPYARKIGHDYVIFSSAYLYGLYKKIFCKQGLYYIQNNELLFNNGGYDPREGYSDTKLIRVANSHWTAEQIENFNKQQVHVVLPGVDHSVYYPKKAVIASYKYNLMGIGDKREWKGKTLFDDVCRLSGIKGYTLHDLDPLHVKASDLLNASEYFINTSIFDGWNTEMLEAMACGTPVITFDNGSSKELAIHKETAYVVPAGSVHGIRWGLTELKSNHELVKTMIEQALGLSQSFTWNRTVSELLSILEDGGKQIQTTVVVDPPVLLKEPNKVLKVEKPKEEKNIEKDKVLEELKKPPKANFNVPKRDDYDYLVDIVIPVYNALKETNLCIESIIKNTDDIKYRIVIVNDGSDKATTSYLRKQAEQYSQIDLLENKKNMGYLKSINRGLIKHSDTPYKICLNSDTIVTEKWASKLIKAAEVDGKVGLVCPLATKANTMTIFPPPGSNFISLNNTVEKMSKHKYPKACTVIGFCMLICQKVIDTIGVFDEQYDPGYYEESDYQYKAREVGFKSVISDDVVIYHKIQASFKESRQTMVKKNRGLFHQRWDHIYKADFIEYDKKNELGYLREKRTHAFSGKISTSYDVMFVMPFYDDSEEVKSVLALADGLLLQGYNVGISVVGQLKKKPDNPYIMPLVFPDPAQFIGSHTPSDLYIATHHNTVMSVVEIAKKFNSKIMYYIQDFYSAGGGLHNVFESYGKIANKVTTAKWIQGNLLGLGYKSDLIYPGIDLYNYYQRRAKNNKFTIVGKTHPDKKYGFKDLKTLFMILKKLDKTLDLRFYGSHPDPDIRHHGKLDDDAEASLLSEAHVTVDTTTDQGFGYLGLKALACKSIYFAVHNKGIEGYCISGTNSMLSNANDPFAMAMSIMELKSANGDRRNSLINNGLDTVKEFDISTAVIKFESYIKKVMIKK